MSSQRKLNAREIRAMSREEREKLLNELRAELLKLETTRKRGLLTNPGRYTHVKRVVARILTISREEELAQRIRELLNRGFSPREVSSRLKISENLVRRVFSELRGGQQHKG